MLTKLTGVISSQYMEVKPSRPTPETHTVRHVAYINTTGKNQASFDMHSSKEKL